MQLKSKHNAFFLSFPKFLSGSFDVSAEIHLLKLADSFLLLGLSVRHFNSFYCKYLVCEFMFFFFIYLYYEWTIPCFLLTYLGRFWPDSVLR